MNNLNSFAPISPPPSPDLRPQTPPFSPPRTPSPETIESQTKTVSGAAKSILKQQHSAITSTAASVSANSKNIQFGDTTAVTFDPEEETGVKLGKEKAPDPYKGNVLKVRSIENLRDYKDIRRAFEGSYSSSDIREYGRLLRFEASSEDSVGQISKYHFKKDRLEGKLKGFTRVKKCANRLLAKHEHLYKHRSFGKEIMDTALNALAAYEAAVKQGKPFKA